MKRLHCFVSVALFVCFASPLFAAPGDVVARIPTPASAPTGLAFDGTHLWIADRLTDTLYAIDRQSGQVARALPAPGFVPLGLTWDGAHLWCIDGEEKRILQLDVKTGITLRSLESPTQRPEGLAWDGKYLWLSDGAEDVLCQISTEDGTTIVSYRAPSGNSTGLTYWNGYLWCADRRDDKIFLFDVKHGEVVFGLDAPGKYARGLTSDGQHLYVVDYQADSIFQLVMDDGSPLRVLDTHTLDLALLHEFRNYGPGEVPTFDAYISIPAILPNQKLLSEVRFTPPPQEIIRDRWNQPIAHFRLDNPGLAVRNQVKMEVRAELSEARTLVFPHRVGKLEEIPADVRKTYLVDEDKYRMSDPIIQNAVRAAVGFETNPYWMMRGIHKYIREHLSYELAGGWNVAPKVLERGNGSCSEYTFVFISMCRAAGIPARYVGAVVIRGDDASTDEHFHRWSQVYLPGYGWVHVDPQGGDRDVPAEVAESIGVVENKFLITTEGGGASEYLGWSYNHNEKWTSRGPVKVHVEATGEWSPAPQESSAGE
ncbi:transglutaminase [bacterium]|nr:transglutaminase [bacterium]MBU1983032.1 transglutaminase [bacterium]